MEDRGVQSSLELFLSKSIVTLSKNTHVKVEISNDIITGIKVSVQHW